MGGRGGKGLGMRVGEGVVLAVHNQIERHDGYMRDSREKKDKASCAHTQSRGQ